MALDPRYAFAYQDIGKRDEQQDEILIRPAPASIGAANGKRFLFQLAASAAEALKDTDESGSMITAGLLTKEGKFISANVGDSPAFIILRDTQTGTISIKTVITSHNLKDQKQRDHLKRRGLGAKLKNVDGVYRVDGTMSRGTLGHADKIEITRNPYLQTVDLEFYRSHGMEVVAVGVASDGLTETVNFEKHAAYLQQEMARHPDMSASDIATSMVNFALLRNSADNTSLAIIRPIKKAGSQEYVPMIAIVNDGNGPFGKAAAARAREAEEFFIQDVEQRGLPAAKETQVDKLFSAYPPDVRELFVMDKQKGKIDIAKDKAPAIRKALTEQPELRELINRLEYRFSDRIAVMNDQVMASASRGGTGRGR